MGTPEKICRTTKVICTGYPRISSNKTRHSCILYMSPIAGQTAGIIGLKVFVDTPHRPTTKVEHFFLKQKFDIKASKQKT